MSHATDRMDGFIELLRCSVFQRAMEQDLLESVSYKDAIMCVVAARKHFGFQGRKCVEYDVDIRFGVDDFLTEIADNRGVAFFELVNLAHSAIDFLVTSLEVIGVGNTNGISNMLSFLLA